MNYLCPICKTSYSSDVKFCINDGARLVAAEPTVEQTDPSVYNPFERQPATGLLYPKAPLGNRFLAALLDSLIFLGLAIPCLVCFFIAFITAYGNKESLAIGLCFVGIALFLIPIAFQLLKDGFGQGQSPGKRALKLIVIDLDTNTPCKKTKSFLRNVVALVLGLVPFVGSFIEPVMILVTNDGRRLGDRAANTIVVDKKDYFS